MSLNEYECTHCFEMEEEVSWHPSIDDEEHLCEYCSLNHPTGQKLLERRLEVMDAMKVSRLPSLMRLMYNVLKEVHQ